MSTETKNNLKELKALIDQFEILKDYDIQEIDGGFVVDLPVVYDLLDENEEAVEEVRRQFVYLTANRTSTEGDPIFQVFTICAPEDEQFYKSALLLNMNMPFGAVAISEIEGENHFVLIDTYLVDSVTPKELEASAIALARAGDRMEKILVGEDIS